jgi:hypothetical protein
MMRGSCGLWAMFLFWLQSTFGCPKLLRRSTAV